MLVTFPCICLPPCTDNGTFLQLPHRKQILTFNLFFFFFSFELWRTSLSPFPPPGLLVQVRLLLPLLGGLCCCTSLPGAEAACLPCSLGNPTFYVSCLEAGSLVLTSGYSCQPLQHRPDCERPLLPPGVSGNWIGASQSGDLHVFKKQAIMSLLYHLSQLQNAFYLPG